MQQPASALPKLRRSALLPILGVLILCLVVVGSAQGSRNTPRSGQRPDHYAALGVKKSATSDEIRKAFHKLGKTQHPDKLTNPTQRQKDRWVQIVQAYEVLSDKIKRREYDEADQSGSFYGFGHGFDSEDGDEDDADFGKKQRKSPRGSHQRSKGGRSAQAESAQTHFQMPAWFRRYFHFNLDPDTDYGDEEDYGYFGYSPDDHGYRDDSGRFGSFRDFEKYMSGRSPHFHFRPPDQRYARESESGSANERDAAPSGFGVDFAEPLKTVREYAGWFRDGVWEYLQSQYSSSSQPSPGSSSQSDRKKNCYTVREETPNGIRTYRECEAG